MAKLLVHKRDTVESVAVNGFLQATESALIVVGENGEKVNLVDILSEFDGEEIAFAIKKVDKENIEIIE